MKNEITLLKNNDGKELKDVEWMQEFFNFLQGDGTKKRGLPKLTKNEAFSVIFYLQETFAVFPDSIELCWNCGELYNTDSEGLFWESKGRYYCGGCEHLVPQNYDNNQRK